MPDVVPHPQQHRVAAGGGVLERGGEAAPVANRAADVGGAEDLEHGRVGHAVAHVVARRVRVDRGGVLGVVGGAVLLFVERPDDLRARAVGHGFQHVEHWYLGDNGTPEVRLLGDRHPGDQTAVGGTVEGQPVRRGDAPGDQVLGHRAQVIEGVLLGAAPAGLVPVATVLAAAAQARLHEYATGLHERCVLGEERGNPRQVEAAVGVDQGRLRHGAVQIRPGDHEVGHACAVGRGGEGLLDDDAGQVRARLHHLQGGIVHVEFAGGVGRGERAGREQERGRGRAQPARAHQAQRGTGRRQGGAAHQGAVRLVDADVQAHVAQRADHQPAPDDLDAAQHQVAGGNQFPPGRRIGRGGHGNGDQPTAWRVRGDRHVGVVVQPVAVQFGVEPLRREGPPPPGSLVADHGGDVLVG